MHDLYLGHVNPGGPCSSLEPMPSRLHLGLELAWHGQAGGRQSAREADSFLLSLGSTCQLLSQSPLCPLPACLLIFSFPFFSPPSCPPCLPSLPLRLMTLSLPLAPWVSPSLLPEPHIPRPCFSWGIGAPPTTGRLGPGSVVTSWPPRPRRLAELSGMREVGMGDPPRFWRLGRAGGCREREGE